MNKVFGLLTAAAVSAGAIGCGGASTAQAPPETNNTPPGRPVPKGPAGRAAGWQGEKPAVRPATRVESQVALR